MIAPMGLPNNEIKKDELIQEVLFKNEIILWHGKPKFINYCYFFIGNFPLFFIVYFIAIILINKFDEMNYINIKIIYLLHIFASIYISCSVMKFLFCAIFYNLINYYITSKRIIIFCRKIIKFGSVYNILQKDGRITVRNGVVYSINAYDIEEIMYLRINNTKLFGTSLVFSDHSKEYITNKEYKDIILSVYSCKKPDVKIECINSTGLKFLNFSWIFNFEYLHNGIYGIYSDHKMLNALSKLVEK